MFGEETSGLVGEESTDESTSESTSESTGESTDDGGDPPPLDVLRLVAGGFHMCAQWIDFGVHCWGAGERGQLGNGNLENASTPQPVLDLGLDVVELGAGLLHSCATLESGAAKCWGVNTDGELGDGSNADSTVPVDVVGLSGPAVIVSGAPAHLHTCAALEDGTMMCWGSNGCGELGDGAMYNNVPTPQPVLGLTEVLDFANGFVHTCAVDSLGVVSCWGCNTNGLVDTASPPDTDFHEPQPKVGLSDVVEIGAGANHACARHADGHVSCWGSEGHGQLGDGSGLEHGEPLPVSGLNDAVALASGVTHNCAIRSGGTIACWGHNASGQLGDGSTIDRFIPVEVVGIDDAVQVAVGYSWSCALSESRGILCWGSNNYGQLGDGSLDDSLVPVSVLEPS